MKPIILVILASALLMFVACKSDEKNEDLTNEINKNGSVETDISVQHLDSLNDVLITKHQVWTSPTSSKLIEYRDTIKALGNQISEVENEGSDAKTVSVKKEYEIFITVK